MNAFYGLILLFFLNFSGVSAQKQVIFQEDFNGSQLDMTTWNYEEGDGCPDVCGWGNKELEIYDRNYVSVEDGKLVITAVKESDTYYSGRITTKDKFEFKYGEVEFRAKLASGKGLWPAVWMLGADIDEVGWPASGEIDMLEYVGREPHMVYTTLHSPAAHGDNGSSKKTKIDEIEDGYHTYNVIWNKDFIEFYVDGNSVYKFTPEEYDAENYPFRKDFYLLVNMAIGGNFGGPEVDDSVFPAKFYVDYIKVTQKR